MSSLIGNVVQISELFPLQSYFDAAAELTTPASMAILAQPQNNPIVPSTFKRKTGQSGYALGLAPWSQSPIAVQFDFGDEGQSAPVILKPGEVKIPNGKKPFKGFDFGLPFGWLGGGLVSLFLFKTPDARAEWGVGPSSEVLFHRFRTTILTAPAASAPTSAANWPDRFPWPSCYRYVAGANPVVQSGQPSLKITEQTRTMMQLNQGATSITGDNIARIVFWGSDPFAIGSDGLTPVNTSQFFYDLNWPDRDSAVTIGNNLSPIIELPSSIATIPANVFGIAIYAPIGSVLIGMTVDIVRYGRL